MEIQTSAKNKREEDERLAMEEAATSGLNSMSHLIKLISSHHHPDSDSTTKDLADSTLGSFKRLISVLNNRTGHARFRRAPATAASKQPNQPLTLDFTKPNHPPLSSSSISTVSNPKASRCTCNCSRKRKLRVRKTIRVPAVSSKISDIPADEYSWRKYGQKPIKGSPYPRGYYKCSTVRGCPARKHVERATDDPTMLLVTYEGDHMHSHRPASHTNISLSMDFGFPPTL